MFRLMRRTPWKILLLIRQHLIPHRLRAISLVRKLLQLRIKSLQGVIDLVHSKKSLVKMQSQTLCAMQYRLVGLRMHIFFAGLGESAKHRWREFLRVP